MVSFAVLEEVVIHEQLSGLGYRRGIEELPEGRQRSFSAMARELETHDFFVGFVSPGGLSCIHWAFSCPVLRA
jgi:hypothetical protein